MTNNTITYPEFIKSITNEGEIHVCAFVNEDGSVTHSFLIAEEKDNGNWAVAMERGQELGADLPNRVELAILSEKYKGEFTPDWYWLNEKDANSSYALCQSFGREDLLVFNKCGNCRSRFIRRVTI